MLAIKSTRDTVLKSFQKNNDKKSKAIAINFERDGN